MNKKQMNSKINSIGKILLVIVLLFIIFYTSNECVFQNEGGRNWGGCGVSVILLIVIIVLTSWGFKRIENENIRQKSKKSTPKINLTTFIASS